MLQMKLAKVEWVSGLIGDRVSSAENEEAESAPVFYIR
jgi:hypothetical protein